MTARDANSFLRIFEAPGSVANYFLSHLEGTEGLAQPFFFTLRLSAQGEIPPPAQWIGASITFGLGASDGTLRRINGQCVRIEHSYQKNKYIEFELDVAPLFWSTRFRRDCRIFTEKTALEIIETILIEHGFSFDSSGVDFVDTVREYCVQYWETDFDFCSRLMEEEGIFYYFLFDENASPLKHKMVLIDNCDGYFDGEPYNIGFDADIRNQGIFSIDLQHSQYPASWTTNDYDYRNPGGLSPIRTPTKYDYSAKNTNFYDWPGGYRQMDEGQRLSRFGIERAESDSVIMSGTGTYMGFMPAARFEIIDKRFQPAERRIAIRSVTHTAHNPTTSEEGEFSYEQSFTAGPSYETFHTPRITPKAVVHGPQTAIVLDQTDPDGFGRIKVRFHWDHAGASTCWLRVAQQWGGAELGAQWIPRVGMEVLVVFLEGDPDRPIVAQSLYNADNRHPFTLPQNLSKSGWRTRTYPDGSVTNELVFQDKDGEEEVFIHAGRDYRREVIKDELATIGENSKTRIGKDQTTQIGGNQTTQIAGFSDTTVGGAAHLKVGQGLWVEVADDIRIDAVSATRMVTEGAFTLESKTQLTFQVGGNQIQITPGGITINGVLVRIN